MEEAEEKLELITSYFPGLTPRQRQQLEALDGLYKDWNSKINVISRKDEDSLYERHVLHSLSIAAAFDLAGGMQVLDLGTGGGFPGIPLAIVFPDVQFFLADSIGKKIKVVQAVSAALELKNVQAQQKRAEEIRDRKFDTIVSRAVAPLGDLWKWSKPLLKSFSKTGKVSFSSMRATGGGPHSSATSARPIPQGLICLKGGDLAQEIALSGCRPQQIEIYGLFSRDFFKEKYILYVRA